MHSTRKFMSSAPQKNTPLMQQYFTIKEQYPDSLLFFQVGDFYELFFDDAKVASSFLALTLTKRGKNKGEDIPLCGVPVHALKHYLIKLIKGGFKIALCDQLTKPQPGTVVERGVTHVFTPGTLIDDQLLNDKSASYLLSFYPDKSSWALVFAELLTAQLFATILPPDTVKMLETELTRFSPDEILLPQSDGLRSLVKTLGLLGYQTTSMPLQQTGGEGLTETPAELWIRGQFNEQTQKAIFEHSSLQQGMHALHSYLQKNQYASLSQFKSVVLYEPDDYLILDRATQRNLEIIENSQDGGLKNTLFSVLDRAQTSMGSRTIKKWLQRPLTQQDHIEQRQGFIKELIEKPTALTRLEELFKQLADLERIIGRIALQKAVVRDYVALASSLIVIPAIKELLRQHLACTIGSALLDKMPDLESLQQFLQAALNDDPLTDIIIKPGFNLALDELRNLVTNAQQAILKLEQEEIAASGIGSLKIKFNNITGYYIEITDTHRASIPETYRHVQTLSGRKRFTNNALQELEQKILRSRTDVSSLEQDIFQQVKDETAEHLAPLRSLAHSLAYTDALLGFTRAAYDYNYVQPQFILDQSMLVEESRHPVVEQQSMHTFVRNPITLNDQSRLIILTGPNMGGKSTYLRQIALLSIMAQCGSFVPARGAQLCIFDRIFTRIGSGDNLAEGKSTFFVEMEEAATICTQATKKSLVILDEVGRGTSTYDGMALAQAIIEYIVEALGATCVFATHYHELTHLEERYPSVKNYFAECIEQKNSIIFTHAIKRGHVSQSFGLHVAQQAHLPVTIITRAQEILAQLHSAPQVTAQTNIAALNNAPDRKKQSEIEKFVDSIDPNNLSPRQAFDLVWDLKNLSIREKSI